MVSLSSAQRKLTTRLLVVSSCDVRKWEQSSNRAQDIRGSHTPLSLPYIQLFIRIMKNTFKRFYSGVRRLKRTGSQSIRMEGREGSCPHPRCCCRRTSNNCRNRLTSNQIQTQRQSIQMNNILLLRQLFGHNTQFNDNTKNYNQNKDII